MRVCGGCAGPVDDAGRCLVCGATLGGSEPAPTARRRVCGRCAGPTDADGSCLVCGTAGASPMPEGTIQLSPPPPRSAPRPAGTPATAPKAPFYPERAPNCYQCRFFRITHVPSFPRACVRFGFKGLELPSHTLYSVSGKHCPYFEAIEGRPD